MPHLETEPLIKLYYEQVKDKYPTIDIEAFTLICKSPFRFIKSQMERTDMPIIFIKYFGKWAVRPFTLKKKLDKLELSYNSKMFNILTEEKYLEIKTFLTTKYAQLKAEEELDSKTDMRSAKNRRDTKDQILELIDDTEN